VKPPKPPRWSVTFDGRSARLVRTREVRTKRWWQWQSTVRDVDELVGIYQCRMGLELERKLNRPDVLTLELGGQKLKLHSLGYHDEIGVE
jgi:hypothetical protein